MSDSQTTKARIVPTLAIVGELMSRAAERARECWRRFDENCREGLKPYIWIQPANCNWCNDSRRETMSTALSARVSMKHGNAVRRQNPSALLGVRRILTLDRVINFFTMDGHIARRLNAETHFVATDFDDHESDRVADHNLFVFLAAEY